MKTEEQIAKKLKEHIHNQRAGLEATQERIHNEICAARRRERLVLIPRPLRAAAALLMIGLGFYFALSHKKNDLPICPHSAKAEQTQKNSPYIANEESEIFHLDRIDRICHCAPRYSGSLR